MRVPGLSNPCLAQTAPKFPEGNDFATQVLRDPWDMEEYPDISQYINQSGMANILQHIKVENGLFSARSVDDAHFFPLFPGYYTAMLIGKVGHHFPIAFAKYKTLYIAMKVDSGAPAPWPDMLQILWFADERLNGPGGVGDILSFLLFTLKPEPPRLIPPGNYLKLTFPPATLSEAAPPGPAAPSGKGCGSIRPCKRR